ncbi:conserved hypothetical protein [Paraburkholderia sabiae]|nr:conserved hypothetical protein [Paraburkholderia sabiae]
MKKSRSWRRERLFSFIVSSGRAVFLESLNFFPHAKACNLFCRPQLSNKLIPLMGK